MRTAALLLMSLGLAALAACISEPPPPEPAELPKGNIAGNGSSSSSSSGGGAIPPGPGTTKKPTLEVLQEAVYVLMKDYEDHDWICTGTLISKTRVVTAGHCLATDEFASFLVVAPLAPGAPRVVASNPTRMSDDTDSVENADIGFLTLEEPIELPTYGVLTDVSQQIEAGKDLTATAVVRTKEENEAPFHAVDGLKLKSTTDLGYDHGYGVDLFSHGGDSGAGVFLLENGQATHELVGVCRQPDPDTDTDMLTRIDADVLAWFADH